MCVPVVVDFSFIMFRNRYFAKFIIWQGWYSFLCATPDDHKTQHIDRGAHWPSG